MPSHVWVYDKALYQSPTSTALFYICTIEYDDTANDIGHNMKVAMHHSVALAEYDIAMAIIHGAVNRAPWIKSNLT